jgi:hypothetical protein
MFKSWIIAGSLLIAGIFASILIGKRKQSIKDNAKAEKVVKENLNKISSVSQKAKDDAQNHPDTGPDSSAERLRRDWSED